MKVKRDPNEHRRHALSEAERVRNPVGWSQAMAEYHADLKRQRKRSRLEQELRRLAAANRAGRDPQRQRRTLALLRELRRLEDADAA